MTDQEMIREAKKLLLRENVNTCYPNGKPFKSFSYYPRKDQDNAYDGEYKEWYPNGILNLHCYYKDDELHGKFQNFDEYGEPFQECYYVHGKKQGQAKEFHQDGTIFRLENYLDDKLDGEYQEWDINGTLVYHCIYKNGEIIQEINGYNRTK